MAKKKKIRKQKLLAENKKEKLFKKANEDLSIDLTEPHDHDSMMFKYKFESKSGFDKNKATTAFSSKSEQSHLTQDLAKTGILTTSIIVAQFVLYIILR